MPKANDNNLLLDMLTDGISDDWDADYATREGLQRLSPSQTVAWEELVGMIDEAYIARGLASPPYLALGYYREVVDGITI